MELRSFTAMRRNLSTGLRRVNAGNREPLRRRV